MVKEYNRKNKLIEMAVPTSKNTSVKKYNKIIKSKNLEIEIEKMWHLKIIIVNRNGCPGYDQERDNQIHLRFSELLIFLDVCKFVRNLK